MQAQTAKYLSCLESMDDYRTLKQALFADRRLPKQKSWSFQLEAQLHDVSMKVPTTDGRGSLLLNTVSRISPHSTAQQQHFHQSCHLQRCRKLNGKPAALPPTLQQHSKWQQYMANLCAPASSVPPLPSASAPPGAQQLAAGLNDAITSGEVQAALPLLNNGKSCAKSGWPAELLRYAYKEVTMEDGKVSKLYVLAPVLAALLNSAFQSGTLPAAVKSSLITPVFKKGDESDTSNYRPIAVGEPLCRLYAAILNSRIVNWAETNGLRAPCQAGFRPRLSRRAPIVRLAPFH